MRRPCMTTSLVAVRRKWCTGCARRRSSSAAVPASDGSATSRCSSSGCVRRSWRPSEIVWRVVSLPAVVSRMNMTPNSCSESLERFPSPLLAELPSVLDQVERERARERELAELGVLERDLGDVLGTDDLGVGVAEDLVAELDDQLPVLDW